MICKVRCSKFSLLLFAAGLSTAALAGLLMLGPAWGAAPDDEPAAMKIDEAHVLSLIGRLGTGTEAERDAAFEKLRGMGEPVRPYLKKALDDENPEVRWRASRLLTNLDGRQIMHLGPPPGEDEGTEGGHPDDLSRLKEKLRQLRGLHGFKMGPLSGDFFKEHEKFFQGPFGEIFKEFLKDSPGMDPFGDSLRGLDLFGPGAPDLNKMMESLRQGGFSLKMDGSTATYHSRQKDEEGSKEYTLQIAEDGSVKAQVRITDPKGEVREENYEEKSLEDFQKNHPDLMEKFPTNLGSSLSEQEPKLLRLTDRPPVGAFPQEQAQRKSLGVYVNIEGPDKVLRAQMGLKENEGIIIEKVLPDSLAARLGLEPLDVLVAVNGVTVGSAPEVSRVLSKVESSDKVTVTFLRGGERLERSANYGDAKM